jgi:drug/metabolite transporter (DMT)-like permease
MLLSLWATSLGPVSLVSALSATSSFFLLVYSTLLGLRFKGLLGEEITRRAIAVKGLAITLIMVGVATISLG